MQTSSFNMENMKAMFEMKDISPKTQLHLRNVYANLAICASICTLGMYINATVVLQGFMWTVAILIGMGWCMYKVSNRQDHEQTRMGYLWALAFCMGYLAGPAIHHVAEFNPMILVQAVSYTAIVFGSFTAISLFSKRRSYLFIGGVISSTMSCLFWYSTLSWLFGYSKYGGQFGLVYMMVGLFVACLMVIYDTQLIIERAERGDKDVPTHTMTLFMDLFDVFIKILQLLMKLQEEQRRKESKKEKR